MSEFNLQRVEKPSFGFAMHIPATWREEPPDLKNNAQEVARFFHRGTTIRGVVVFRTVVFEPTSIAEFLAEIESRLRASGATNFSTSKAIVGGLEGARFNFDMPQEGALGGIWSNRQYFVERHGARFCFSMGSEKAEEDSALMDTIARKLELFVPRPESHLPELTFANWFPRARSAYSAGEALANGRREQLTARHLLLGLMEIQEGVAFDVLRTAGLSLERLRQTFEAGDSQPVPQVGQSTAHSASAYRILATSAPQLAAALRHPYIGTEHLILAILTDDADEDGARRMLETTGTSAQAVRNALADVFEEPFERIIRGVQEA